LLESSSKRTTITVTLSTPPFSFASPINFSAAAAGTVSACNVPAISGSVTMRVSPSEHNSSTSRYDLHLIDVNLHFRMSPQRAQQHTLHVALFRLLRGDQPAPDLLGNQRVIVGQLLQISAAQQIRPAIPHVRDA